VTDLHTDLTERLRELDAKATAGPWAEIQHFPHQSNIPVESVPGEVEVCDVTTGEGGATDEDYANAALIVLLRNSVPQILSSLEELSRLKAGCLSAPSTSGGK
jgi:hypothetical protein